jgi:hypothetical protein
MYQTNYIKEIINKINCVTKLKEKIHICIKIDNTETSDVKNIVDIISPDNIKEIIVFTLTPTIELKNKNKFCTQICFNMSFISKDEKCYSLEIINKDNDEVKDRYLSIYLNKLETIPDKNIMDQYMFEYNISTKEKVKIYNELPKINDKHEIKKIINIFTDDVYLDIAKITKLYNEWNDFCKKYNLNITIREFIEDSIEFKKINEIDTNKIDMSEFMKLCNKVIDYKDDLIEYDPKRFSYLGGTGNPSCGGTGLRSCIMLKTITIDELFDCFNKQNIDSYREIKDYSMKRYDYKEHVIVFEIKNTFIYVEFVDDDCSCAGHWITLNIYEYSSIEDLCEHEQLPDFVKTYVTVRAPSTLSVNYYYVTQLSSIYC